MRKKAWIIFGIIMIIAGFYMRILFMREDIIDYELVMYNIYQYGAYIIGVISLIYGLVNSEQRLKDKAEEQRRKREQPVEIKKHHVVILLVLIVAFVLVSCSIIKSENSTSRWDSLSDQEKQWYHDNYGNGKSDAYDKAIEDYKN